MKSHDLERVVFTHAERGLELTTRRGLQSVMRLNNDPGALVTELLRLAVLGAEVEAAVNANPRMRVNTAASCAAIRWRAITQRAC